MKYQANPVIVDAYRIVEVGEKVATRITFHDKKETYYFERTMKLDNGESVHASDEACAQIMPKVGDYWVIQSDGCVFLSPASVFYRKYSPIADLTTTVLDEFVLRLVQNPEVVRGVVQSIEEGQPQK